MQINSDNRGFGEGPNFDRSRPRLEELLFLVVQSSVILESTFWSNIFPGSRKMEEKLGFFRAPEAEKREIPPGPRPGP